MEIRMMSKITGVQANKGTLQDGKPYDSTKIYIESELKGENSTGYATQPFAWGKSDNALKIKHLPFPVTAELVCVMKTNGKGDSTMIVADVLPVDLSTGELKKSK